ncbi:sugar kinase [Actinomadura rupiterrae]|uniref:sugar kinase n=1 Tax=Actinomadura rupiterrae TaxID=559627 RepID=UPI0020A32577|nr:sugar kinase [Actinomadura rupiterrae]MCP2340228.1 2-dehydro-3-deoxygluconokinase [Actinomadura rupiterrae]
MIERQSPAAGAEPVAGTGPVACVGEAMAAFLPDRPGPLEHVETFRHAIGGAEANVARGLAALGVPAAWVGRVGADGFGRRIVAELAASSVDTSGVVTDPDRPTGLFVKEAGPDGSVLHYYRDGSAGSALSPEMMDVRVLRDAPLVHLSGITPALSEGAHKLVAELLQRRVPGRLTSFDLNHRPALWPPGTDAAATLVPLLDAADIVLLGADEAERVLGTGDPERLRALLPGPDVIVVKDDKHRATAVTRDALATEVALRVEVVEPVGAGDAFAAGFLAGTLRGLDPRGRLRLGHLAAAGALVVHGDHGPPPPPDRIAALLAASPAEWAATTITRGIG